MHKINLLHKIRNKQIQKKKATRNSVWIIVKEHNDTEYYVQKADKKGIAVFWTNNLDNAMKFHTETGCQHFVHSYMQKRNDIHLKWIEE